MARPEPRINTARRQATAIAQQTNTAIVAAASASAVATDVVTDALATGDLPNVNSFLADKLTEIGDRLAALEEP